MDSGEGVARLSPVEDDSGGVKNLLVSDLCEDISRLCTSFVQAAEPNMNGCEEKQLVCGGDVGRIVEEVELEVDSIGKGDMTSKVLLSGIGTSVVQLNGKMTSEVQSTAEAASKMQSNREVADKVCSSRVMTSEVQSAGVVASWSATLLPRYQCDDGECSIQSCLNQFTALELMTGNNKVGCEKCTQHQNQGKLKHEICLNLI
jgi:ubiquitin carboxyl-terminal hydrolase 16/45